LGSLSHDLNRWWYNVRGKKDPYLKIGEENNRSVKGESEYVWALHNINFEVKEGEVLGIIGRNGAGKSTLLKILSRTTTPTTGQIKIKGRVASLLEVGTGFHPELTGRENIFLNGAILGMTKQEIKNKFDEIVDFAGVERYIDTPVKRFSSGMYVRLAFGVAAHLEPEILIVDEVLAVGDAEFQKKAIGKMRDVSGKDGRTVLFVSHNMLAIRQLCKNGILLENGVIESEGEIPNLLKRYLQNNRSEEELQPLDNYRNYSIKDSPISINRVYIKGASKLVPELSMNCELTIITKVITMQPIKSASVTFRLTNSEDINVGVAFSWDDNFFLSIPEPGSYEIHFRISNHTLTPGKYFIQVGLNQTDKTVAWDGISNYPIFTIENKNDVHSYLHRSWGVNHFVGNEWKLYKV
jgi:lipopolysaccharide transport system ATP-binding protein